MARITLWLILYILHTHHDKDMEYVFNRLSKVNTCYDTDNNMK